MKDGGGGRPNSRQREVSGDVMKKTTKKLVRRRGGHALPLGGRRMYGGYDDGKRVTKEYWTT